MHFTKINILIAEQSLDVQREMVEKLCLAGFFVHQNLDTQNHETVTLLHRHPITIAMTGFLPYAEAIVDKNRPTVLFVDWNLHGRKEARALRFGGAILAEDALCDGKCERVVVMGSKEPFMMRDILLFNLGNEGHFRGLIYEVPALEERSKTSEIKYKKNVSAIVDHILKEANDLELGRNTTLDRQLSGFDTAPSTLDKA